MNRYIVIIGFIFLFVSVNAANKFEQRKTIEENAILENILSFESLGRLFKKYYKNTFPAERVGEAFNYAVMNFYNDTDLPQWYKQALQRLMLSAADVLKLSKVSDGKAIKQRDQNSTAFEEALKLNCSKETYEFCAVTHSYIASFEEGMGYDFKKLSISHDAEAAYILVALSASDNYFRELLFYFYKENNNQDAIRWLNKRPHLAAEEKHKNIAACLAAFHGALEKEKQRIQSNDIEPVFYLVIAALSPSYHVPESFLREFRIYLIQLAENAKKYHSSDPQFSFHIKRINEEFNKILQANKF